MLKNLIGAGVIGLGVAISSPALASTVNTISNVVFIVDESGSMGGDQDFLKNTVVDKLDSELAAAGVTDRSYGVVGFGNSSVAPRVLGGSLTTSTTDTKNNLDSLLTNGGTEDGWAAINFAISAFNYSAGAAINFILVTDEDRDNWDTSLNYSSVLKSLTSRNILLNAVVSNTFYDGSNTRAIGIDDGGDAYLADGSGGYTTSTGGYATNSSTKSDYVDMALATGGAAWDINLMRSSTTSLSFTEAFVDIKVQEITTQPPSGAIPLPAGAWLMLTGIAGLGVARRRKTKS